MPRLFDLSEDELLDLEGKWWEREDETNLNWILEGEKIYKALSRVNPSEITYRETLGYLLVLQGEDLKLRKHSYEKAIVRFNQVVRIDPQNSRAYYRLGFLYFHQENWAKSVEAFQQSLRCSPNLKSNRLEKEQQVKAHFYILRATQIIAKETMAKVEQIPDEDLSLFGEIHNLLKELKASESQEEKPYQMIINGTEFHEITEREYEAYIDTSQYSNCLILNHQSMNDVTLSLNGPEIAIPATHVPLLEYLMRHPKGVSNEEIINRRYRNSRDPHGSLRRSISRLRRRMKALVPLEDLIETIDGGYRWNPSYEYRMFKHKRNVGSDLLLE